MARLNRRRWLLDTYAEPTARRVSPEEVGEALYALQIEAGNLDAAEIASSPLGTIVVALVKHLARTQGSWHAVELGDASYMDEDERPARPRIEEIIQEGS